MEKIEFTFKRGGRTKLVTQAQAKALQRAKMGTYQTCDMAAQPMVTRPMVATTTAAPAVAQPRTDGDGLDSMDREQLHALAKERGVKVHHMAGADKVRAALREAA